jgi:spore coat polysaccharide biosynthesis protein SpsF (cytidylyltransferase family)
VIAVVQARMGSHRLPGKVLAPIGDRPLIAWTLAALAAVNEVSEIVVATTILPEDDRLADRVRESGWAVHRGSPRDVLSRCWEAVALRRPDLVVRATADNPFIDPVVVGAQVRQAIVGGFDYVGTAGWPLGIAVEVARAEALETAVREATDPAEREHVMPFLYNRPERFRIGSWPPVGQPPPGRFTVDTAEDLAFARAVAARLGPRGRPPTLDDLASVVTAEPGLLELNRSVRQKAWQEAE